MFLLHPFLTVYTIFPTDTRSLIPAQMNIAGGEKLHHLIQNILHKSESRLFGTINIIENTPTAFHLKRPSGTGIFRICCQCRHAMSWHFYFRNNFHKTLLGVCHHFFDIFLCIKSAITLSVPLCRIIPHISHNRFFTVTSDGSQFGIFLDFDTPSLVISQMPMKDVQLMKSKQVNMTLYILLRNEMTGNIKHHSAIRKCRRIFYHYTRDIPFYFFRHQLVAFNGRRQ